MKSKYSKVLFGLSFLGLLFSGYLSAVKLFTDTCAFGESCPYFLGYPACWYGFGMYLILFVATGLALLGKVGESSGAKIALVVSGIGILFAGNFALREIINGSATGALGFSTCVYGLIFYVLIFFFSAMSLSSAE